MATLVDHQPLDLVSPKFESPINHLNIITLQKSEKQHTLLQPYEADEKDKWIFFTQIGDCSRSI